MFLGKKKDAEAWRSQGGGEELRLHPRMSIKTLVNIRAGRREANCKLHDISLGGLSVIAPWSLGIGDAVSLALEAPPGLPKAPKGPQHIEAKVCRVIASKKHEGMFQTGVRFEKPSPEATEVVRLWFQFFGEAAEKRGKK